MQLNEEQQNIVKAPHNKPILITAGAGTGKTRTLIERFLHLKQKFSLKSDRILLLTFTNKAANEMKDRVTESLPDLTIQERENLWIHTFHSFCSRILKEESPSNLEADFEVIDATDQQMLFHQVYLQMQSLRDNFDDAEPKLTHLYPMIKDHSDFEKHIYSLIDSLRNRLISLDDFKKKLDLPDSPESTALKKIVYQIYSQYDQILEENGLKDFPKLICDTTKFILKHPIIQNKYQEKFRFVMVDEFQDTNHAQDRLLKAVSRIHYSNLTVVGDLRQSIYQWRGTDPINLKNFAKLPDVQNKDLLRNYRSYGEILDFSYRFLQITPHANLKPLIPETKNSLDKPVIFCFENKTDEPLFIASEIRRLIDEENYSPNKIALLFRTIKNKVMPYEKALADLDIPFYTSGNGSFFERKEIKLIMAYLSLINNPLDKMSLVKILVNKPYCVSDAYLYELSNKSKNDRKKLYEQIREIEQFDHLCNLIDHLSRQKNKIGIVDLFFEFLDNSSIEETLFDQPAYNCVITDTLNKFLNMLKSFTARKQDADLSSFIDYFNHAATKLDENEDLEKIQSQNCVRLLTLHKAKGLEYPIVFLVDPQLKKPSIKNPFFFDFATSSFAFKGSDNYEKFKKTEKLKQFDELQRLYYVGITRAEEKLYITGKKLEIFRNVLENCKQNSWQEITDIPEIKNTEHQPCLDKNQLKENLVIIKNNLESKPKTYNPTAPPITLSCSTLHEYETCPYKFYLQYVLRLPKPEQNISPTSSTIKWNVLGTAVHEAIEEYDLYNGNIPLQTLAEKKISDFDNTEVPETIVTEALDYYKTTPYYNDNSIEFINEFPFTVKIDSTQLRGQIDKLYLKNDSCTIVDYKTGYKGVTENYILQMRLYALACQTLFGVKKVKADLLFLNQKRIDSIEITQENIQNCKDYIAEISQNITNKTFKTKKSPKCRFCQFYNHCNEQDKSVPITNPSTYYQHFYELISLEEKTCLDTSDDQKKYPVKFIKSKRLSKENNISIITFYAETYSLKNRTGDFIKLFAKNAITATAQIVAIDFDTVSILSNETKNWSIFQEFSEWTNPLPFSRMKDNILAFVKNDSPLKNIILQNELPNIYQKNADLSKNSKLLDKFQKKAVSKAITNQDILIIHGPPGTGKTVTIAHIVEELTKRGKRVLISAYTNKSVDAILLKISDLIDNRKIARIGRTTVVHPKLADVTIDESTSSDQISIAVKDKYVVAVTSAGIYKKLFQTRFDTAIIDEASQMPEPFAIGILNCSKKLIMVGDNKQLPPIITDKTAQKKGLNVSLFDRMKKHFDKNASDSIVMLENQYRMNKELLEFPSRFFYDNMLKTGNKKTAEKRLQYPNPKTVTDKEWLLTALDPNNPLVYIKTHGENDSNITCISQIVQDGLIKQGLDPKEIGIISPFRKEVAKLRKKLSIENLEIDTVDRFQGSDKEVIILSCPTQNGTVPKLIADHNRLNVAITRAKSKLILVGAEPTCTDESIPFIKLLQYIKDNASFNEYKK